MTTNMPKFNFKPTLTEQDMLKAEKETKASGGKVFQPGQYDLKITEFALNATEKNPEGTASGDKSWLVFKLVLGGIDSRSINTFVLLPTRDLTYNKPGSKNPKLMGIKLREFFRALGLDPSVEKMPETLQKLINNPEIIIGQPITVKIGYQGPYVAYDAATRLCSLVDRNGGDTILPGETFPDRDSAKAVAAEIGILDKLKAFPEVTRFIEAKVSAEEEVVEASDWN